MKPSNKADLTKLSHLIRAGAIVHSLDGGVYYCTSKLASGKTMSFRLADLQGKPVQIPADFKPISPALARFASWMRYVVAFNKDFDLYVKEYIRRAKLPVDPKMDWSKFFAARVAPRLASKDPEIQDEAIYQIIIKTLAERNVLANFPSAIKKFPTRIQELPLERQVSTFLMQNFNWRINEANEYIKKVIYQDGTDSMWGTEGDEEEGEPVNLLDTEDRADMGAYDVVDADIEIDRFRRGFSDYLHNKFREKTAEQYLTLFDLIYQELKATEEIPGPSDVWAEWYRETAERCLSCNGTGRWGAFDSKGRRPQTEGMKCPDCKGLGATNGKSTSWFKVLFTNLPKLIDTYIDKHLTDLNYRIHPFLEIMRNIGQNRKRMEHSILQPVHASVFGGLKLADDFPINHEIEQSDNSNSGSGGGLGDLSSALGDAGEEAAGAAEELAPLAMAVASKNAAQWEVPKCKACGNAEEPTDCLACHEKFCHDCMLNHHANNPSHDRVASKRADLAEEYAQGDDYYSCAMCHTKNWTRKDGVLRCLTCHPIEKTAAFCNEKGCEGSKPGETYCDDCDRCAKHCICPGCHCKKAAMDAEDRGFREMDTALDIKRIAEDVIGNGLFESSPESHFSWNGCAYCGAQKAGEPQLGGDVYDIKGFRNLEDAKAANREERQYEFELCGECLNRLMYGDMT